MAQATKSKKAASSPSTQSSNAKTTSKAKKSAKAIATLGRLETFTESLLKQDLPAFRSGDKVVVKSKIKEGDKERVQAFEGVVIARDGRSVNETFTVRKISAGVGVERIYPLHSPNIVSIEVKVEGFVRRGKLYYLRNLAGKKARIQDKNLKLAAAMGGDLSASAQETTSTEAAPST